MGLHLLKPQLLLLLLVEVGHGLEGRSGCGHELTLRVHVRLDVDSFSLRLIVGVIILHAESDQVNELSALHPSIICVFVFRYITLL